METNLTHLPMVMRRLFLTGLFISAVYAQHQPAAKPSKKHPLEDMAAVERGHAQFKSTCGFCHGEDAKGSRAPDLTRSSVVSHDEKGSTIEPLLRQGIIDQGMPSFPNLTENQIAGIVAFLHHQMLAAQNSNGVSSDYPLAKLLTGSAEAGKAYFDGPGRCTQCHSVTGNLAGIAKKYTPIDLQQHMVYPSAKTVTKTATVTLNDGTKYEGKIDHQDSFNIGIVCQDGWYRSWPINQVQVEVHDPLSAHQDLMTKYTDADIHNLFAYLETLK